MSRELVTDESLLNDLQYGNKIAILVGDILIANASKKTSELNNCKVRERRGRMTPAGFSSEYFDSFLPGMEESSDASVLIFILTLD